jgi:4-hydroxybenzoate polyprenyltransferase
MAALSPRSPARAWLQLLRPPNLFTVPGDPFVGYLFANSGVMTWSVLAAVGASLLLYSAGLVLNDLADLAEDRRERPSRPLPSGAVALGPAWGLALLLAAAGLTCAWLTGSRASFAVAAGLLLTVALYDFLLKRWALPGALAMGLCRSLSVMIGALAGPVSAHFTVKPHAIGFAAVIGLYIAAVTNLARHETRDSVPLSARIWPAAVLILGSLGGFWLVLTSRERHWAAAFLLLAIVAVLRLAAHMFDREKTLFLPPLIGSHIRLLLVLQAAGAFLADPWIWGLPAAVLLVLLWPLSWKVSRWFYAS